MHPVAALPPRTLDGGAFAAAALVGRKDGRRVTVCLPARNEAATVGAIVATIRRELRGLVPLVDEIVVVDDGSTDATAAVAGAAGARVVAGTGSGKGDAMHTGLVSSDGDLVVYCDADVAGFRAQFVVGLLGPLLVDEGTTFVKGFYQRPLDGRVGEGGRVTELLARPLLRTFFPALAAFRQPLAGEIAAPRSVLAEVPFVSGYGVDVALLVDVAERFGSATMAQVDLGTRIHRNRPLAELGPQAEVVLRTVLSRAGVVEPVAQRPPLAGGLADRKTA